MRFEAQHWLHVTDGKLPLYRHLIVYMWIAATESEKEIELPRTLHGLFGPLRSRANFFMN